MEGPAKAAWCPQGEVGEGGGREFPDGHRLHLLRRQGWGRVAREAGRRRPEAQEEGRPRRQESGRPRQEEEAGQGRQEAGQSPTAEGRQGYGETQKEGPRQG